MASATPVQRLARAKGYPYARPDSSFLYVGRKVYRFHNSAWISPSNMQGLTLRDGASTLSVADALQMNRVSPKVLDSEWTPILAIGSNAGPEQLARKFPTESFPDNVLIPVVECVLEDFDVVYTPYITTYGSCPATLEHSPGTAASVFLTYLTPQQVERMHATEANYNYCELAGVRLHVGHSLAAFRQGASGASLLSSVYQYNHKDGTMHLPLQQAPGAATPVALAEINALNRRFPALSQQDMLRALAWTLQHSSPDGTLAPVDLPLPSSRDSTGSCGETPVVQQGALAGAGTNITATSPATATPSRADPPGNASRNLPPTGSTATSNSTSSNSTSNGTSNSTCNGTSDGTGTADTHEGASRVASTAALASHGSRTAAAAVVAGAAASDGAGTAPAEAEAATVVADAAAAVVAGAAASDGAGTAPAEAEKAVAVAATAAAAAAVPGAAAGEAGWRQLQGLDEWILSNLDSTQRRVGLSQRLVAGGARPFQYPHTTVVLRL